MRDPALSIDDLEVLRQVDLPALAPLCDKTIGAVARRAALSPMQVEGALERLADPNPPLVRRVVDAKVGEFWVGIQRPPLTPMTP